MNTFPITRIRAVREPWLDGISFLIENTEGSRRRVCTDMTMQEVDEAVEIRPSFTLRHDVAQRLMDELWNCGLRPTEGSGSAGSLAATQRHLEDMRSLVFKTEPKK